MTIRGFFVLVFILVLVGIAFVYVENRRVPEDTEFAAVTIKGRTFRVEVADTPASRAEGLSNREFLHEDQGMLFVFPRPGIQRFWMKNTLIPLDIIWLEGNVVVGFEENVMPEPGVPSSELRVYRSPQGVDRVLEFPAGTAARLFLETGDTASVQF